MIEEGPYMRTVRLALRHPGTTLALAAALLVIVQIAYGKYGRGVEFFPNVEPDYGQVIVHARGNLSLEEKNRLLGEVERRVLEFDGLKTVYARIGEQQRGMSELTEDTIGVIQFEFAHWRARAPAHQIMDAIREKTGDIPGILIEVTAPRAGPPTGKPIQVQLSAVDPSVLPAAAAGKEPLAKGGPRDPIRRDHPCPLTVKVSRKGLAPGLHRATLHFRSREDQPVSG